MNGTARRWSALRASFWFTPAVIVLSSLLAAAGLVEVDAWQSVDLAEWSPRLFGAGADGSRAMLSAIATSMITVAGVVFSITIVTLSLTATQYSPRVLRNFMRDAPTQVVLGVFLGIFGYCMVVLRTIRGGDEGIFIPSLAVLGGMAYAFVGIAVLIYFIHHTALGIQASSILLRIAEDTTAAIDHLFPQDLGDPREVPAEPGALPVQWMQVAAERSGYLVSIDDEALLRLACETGRVLRLALPVGAFVTEGAPLAAASGPQPLEEGIARRLRDCVALGSQRTVEQDAAFGLQQLVDVGLRALSPGINDPTTACMCVHRLGALLSRLAARRMPDPFRFYQAELRVIAQAPQFERLVEDTFGPLLRHCRGDLQVLGSVLDAVEMIAFSAKSPERRRALLPILRALRVLVAQVRPRADTAVLRRRVASAERACAMQAGSALGS